MPFDNTPQGPDYSKDIAILRKARHRIRSKSRWIGGGSTHAIGFGLFHVKRCAWTAVLNAGGLKYARDVWAPGPRALLEAASRRGYWSFIALNDAPETKHADVLAMFDAAIELLENGYTPVHVASTPVPAGLRIAHAPASTVVCA